jgi:hypothetical protein
MVPPPPPPRYKPQFRLPQTSALFGSRTQTTEQSSTRCQAGYLGDMPRCKDVKGIKDKPFEPWTRVQGYKEY